MNPDEGIRRGELPFSSGEQEEARRHASLMRSDNGVEASRVDRGRYLLGFPESAPRTVECHAKDGLVLRLTADKREQPLEVTGDDFAFRQHQDGVA